MRFQLRSVNDKGVRYQCLAFVCPGCVDMEDTGQTGLHMLPVNTTAKTPQWDWDGSLEAATLSPSILSHGYNGGRCHSYLRAGVFEFLGDCTHDMAGQFVPAPELPEWFQEQTISGAED